MDREPRAAKRNQSRNPKIKGTQGVVGLREDGKVAVVLPILLSEICRRSDQRRIEGDKYFRWIQGAGD